MRFSMFQTVAKLLLPAIVITAIAFLVKGYVSPGDGFSAGVIAAAGVLLQYVTFGFSEAERRLPIRYAALSALGGLAAALVLAFIPVLWGKPILTFLPPAGSPVLQLGSVELVGAFAFDIAVFFLVFGFVVASISAIARSSQRTER